MNSNTDTGGYAGVFAVAVFILWLIIRESDKGSRKHHSGHDAHGPQPQHRTDDKWLYHDGKWYQKVDQTPKVIQAGNTLYALHDPAQPQQIVIQQASPKKNGGNGNGGGHNAGNHANYHIDDLPVKRHPPIQTPYPAYPNQNLRHSARHPGAYPNHPVRRIPYQEGYDYDEHGY